MSSHLLNHVTENGDSLQTGQSLDGHNSAQMQHRATLGLFFTYNLVLLFRSAGFCNPLLSLCHYLFTLD